MAWPSQSRPLMAPCSRAQPAFMRLLQFLKRPKMTWEVHIGPSVVTTHFSNPCKVPVTPTDQTVWQVAMPTIAPWTQVTISHLVISTLITHQLPKENSLILETVLVLLTKDPRAWAKQNMRVIISSLVRNLWLKQQLRPAISLEVLLNSAIRLAHTTISLLLAFKTKPASFSVMTKKAMPRLFRISIMLLLKILWLNLKIQPLWKPVYKKWTSIWVSILSNLPHKTRLMVLFHQLQGPCVILKTKKRWLREPSIAQLKFQMPKTKVNSSKPTTVCSIQLLHLQTNWKQSIKTWHSDQMWESMAHIRVLIRLLRHQLLSRALTTRKPSQTQSLRA